MPGHQVTMQAWKAVSSESKAYELRVKVTPCVT